MSAAERDFNNFYLGDDVYELADGVIPQIAERLDFPLSNEPNRAELSQLVGKVGSNKVLRENAELSAIDRDTAIGFVEASGVQKSMDRSLWTPELETSGTEVIVMTGGVANWMDRGARLATSYIFDKSSSLSEDPSPRIIIAAGTRVMNGPTEKNHPIVESFVENNGHFPIEAEYGRDAVTHGLQLSTGIDVENFSADSSKGSEIAELLFRQYPELLDQKITFARVANAGVQLAVQMRKAAQAIDPSFDSDPKNPQAFVLTDEFPLATNEAQEARPKDYQKAATALRQVAVTAKSLHEASGGE